MNVARRKRVVKRLYGCRILDGNPSDEQQWPPSLQAHLKLKTFRHHRSKPVLIEACPPTPPEQRARDLGVKPVILPKHGYRSKARLKHKHGAWFVKGRHGHAGVEGRIRVLNRAQGLRRCLAHGLPGFHGWVGWGVIAGNLAVLGRT